jgi:hypothetical protein
MLLELLCITMGNLNPFCRAIFCVSREVVEVHTNLERYL